jgi:hypothetical protein
VRPNSAEVKLIQGMDHHLEIMGTSERAYEQRVIQHKGGPYAEDLSIQITKWLCAQASCQPSS